jgi:hypothetical protein
MDLHGDPPFCDNQRRPTGGGFFLWPASRRPSPGRVGPDFTAARRIFCLKPETPSTTRLIFPARGTPRRLSRLDKHRQRSNIVHCS